MANPAIDEAKPVSMPQSRWLPIAEVGLILAVFFLQGAWPAPEVNEPHYLSKAKHYWNPGWCPNDFFCGTADAHQVFYWTFGWLSRFLSLPALAWTGRLLTWGLLAWSWRRLSVAVAPQPGLAILSAALFVAGNSRMHMAGEWVVGGVEAKGFAYVLVFLGLEALVRNRWSRVWLLLGAAAAFHVIIGGWAVIAAGVAWLCSKSDRPSVLSMTPALLAGFALSLLGLVPALTLGGQADPAVVNEANRIYVFERLAHHLVPQRWPTVFVLRHLLLWTIWIGLTWAVARRAGEKRLSWFVAGTVGLAVIGGLISLLADQHELLAAKLLRFYWFRMSDAIVPVGAALLAIVGIARLRNWRPEWGSWVLVGAMALSGVHFGELMVQRRAQMVPPADLRRIDDLPNWREVCKWAAQNTPPDAVFLTPRMAETFRWYAQRGEVTSYKDIPQDAAGIVEWWDRLNRLYRIEVNGQPAWLNSPCELSREKLIKLGRRYGAKYVITSAYPRLPLGQISPPNPSYVVYRLPETDKP